VQLCENVVFLGCILARLQKTFSALHFGVWFTTSGEALVGAARCIRIARDVKPII
jgi:hypothetical protein